MATITCFQYPWAFAPGVQVNQNYYGYITYQSPPIHSSHAASVITAVADVSGKLSIVSTAVDGIGVGMSVLFTMQNQGYSSITNWTIYHAMIEV